ncbi:hypothetical protein D3M59_02830 [Sphingomonas edaphi]|uniref:Uncharacterized protein n=1 Tax=Sphingomonas edaphi TaxID=2315689 RepID=A0A418Q1X0_9SPHN|nr:hypothetical protein D3M59_02830 [Sphingomonas edaphi]
MIIGANPNLLAFADIDRRPILKSPSMILQRRVMNGVDDVTLALCEAAYSVDLRPNLSLKSAKPWIFCVTPHAFDMPSNDLSLKGSCI